MEILEEAEEGFGILTFEDEVFVAGEAVGEAVRLEATLPSGVRGRVVFLALRRLDSACCWETRSLFIDFVGAGMALPFDLRLAGRILGLRVRFLQAVERTGEIYWARR